MKILGKKTTAIYLFSIILCAFVAGYILDFLSPDLNVFSSDYHVHVSGGLFTYISSAFLFGIILNSVRLKYFKKNKENSLSKAGVLVIFIDGMTCSHCEESLINTVKKLIGIKDVLVDLKTGEVKIVGEGYGLDEVKNAIIDLGFKVK